MNTTVKHLDRKFLSNYYREMADQIEEVFELFLSETPNEIRLIRELLRQNKITEAGEKIHKIAPSFLSIGLPQLSVKLQIVEVFINYSNLCTAKSLMRLFVIELKEYMPAILAEHRRLMVCSCSTTSA